MADAPPQHTSLRSATANSRSSVLGLSLNKHGLSFQQTPSSPQQSGGGSGRIAALPPLQLAVPTTMSSGAESQSPRHSPSASRSWTTDSSSSSSSVSGKRPAAASSNITGPVNVDDYFQRACTRYHQQKTPAAVESCRALLFASTTLHTAVRRCLALCTGSNCADIDTISEALNKSDLSTEKLVQCLDQEEQEPSSSSSERRQRLDRPAMECVRHLQALCVSLQQQLPILVPRLDPRFARHLLLTIQGTTIDIKDACDTLQAAATAPAPAAIPAGSPRKPQQQLLSPDTAVAATTAASSSPTSSSKHHPLYLRTRSHSEHATASSPGMASPVAPSPLDEHDRSQLYTHLKLAVTHSLHVADVLKQSIAETLDKELDVTPSLRQKLLDLEQQAKRAADMAVRLDKGLQQQQSTVIDPPHKAFWQETNEYLKANVAVMSAVRSISTQEEFGWPKAVKQGCLQVTRVTAEVAKVWNRYSAAFAGEEQGSSSGSGSGKGSSSSSSSSSSGSSAKPASAADEGNKAPAESSSSSGAAVVAATTATSLSSSASSLDR